MFKLFRGRFGTLIACVLVPVVPLTILGTILAAAIDHDRYDVVAFGDSPAMADELGALVVKGPKRATAGLLRDYDSWREALPQVGEKMHALGSPIQLASAASNDCTKTCPTSRLIHSLKISIRKRPYCSG